MSAQAVRQEIRHFVPRVLQQDRRTAKVIAFHTGATPRAVENWRDGLHEPSAANLILLARQIPELKAKVLEWLGADGGDGNDPERLLSDIAKLLNGRVK